LDVADSHVQIAAWKAEANDVARLNETATAERLFNRRPIVSSGLGGGIGRERDGDDDRDRSWQTPVHEVSSSGLFFCHDWARRLPLETPQGDAAACIERNPLTLEQQSLRE
jgi:hypothetical protein